MFLKAVSAHAAAAGGAGGKKAADSQMFLKAVEPPKASAASAAPVQPGAPAAVDVAAVAAAAPDAYPGDNAPQAEIAAWMAGQAEKRGLPPELPLMASLVESGMKNLNFGDADSVGFFQMRVGIWNQGAYAGYPDDPSLQVKWFLDNAETVKKARIASGKSIDDPNQYGDWIADVERPAEQYRGRYQTKLGEAQGLLKSRAAAPPEPVAPAPVAVAAAQPVAAQAPLPYAQPAPPVAAVVEAAAAAPAGGGSPLGGEALKIAKTQLGVREIGGANRGQQVEQYLAAAKVAPGNPWCASFITWSLEQAGHKMPGGGWAGVQTWVRNAEQGANGLKIVSAADARPGDIVAYDWGGQNDFGSDGHIGFLDSTVKDGKFTALEGNNADAVEQRPAVDGQREHRLHPRRGQRDAGCGRRRGRPAGAARGRAPVQPVAPTPYAQPGGQQVAAAVETAPAAPRQPIDPTQFGGDGKGGAPDPEALALLKNKNVVLDPDGIADIKAGRIDPRVVAVMTKLSSEHKITVTCMCSDHDKFTAGGSVSNHHFGRGMDIGAIDGEIVGPGSPLAREVASELSSFNSDIRPNEIGSPFAIAGPGYFTDAAHQNHLHIGFKEAITPDWKPPAEVSAPGDAAPAAAAPVVAAQPVAAPVAAPVASAAAVVPPVAPPPVVPEPAGGGNDSQMFLKAVSAHAASAGGNGGKKAADSQMFLKAVEPPTASAAAAPPVQPAVPVQPGQPVAAQPVAGAPVVDAAAVAAAAPDAYPGDNAPREQIAAWMAGQAQKRGLPPQLPADGQPRRVGAEEPQLRRRRLGRVLPDARRDLEPGRVRRLSRTSPNCRSSGSSTMPRRVKKQRLVAGESIDDPNQFGDWIADVERPAEQYRGRYQTKLAEANGLLGSSHAAGRTGRGGAAGRRAGRRGGRGGRGRGRRRRGPAGRDPRSRAGGDRRRQRARPEGDGRHPGGVEVHRHRLQVGRVDAADRVRLLGPDAVGLRAVRGADPARHLHADRGAERHRDRRPRRAEAGRPRVLRRQRRRPPRGHVPRRTTSSCTRRTPATW